MAVHIEVLTEVTDEVVEAMRRLIPQVSSSAAPITRQILESVVASPDNTVFIARDDELGIAGSLTLVTFTILTGTRAWIEDVVVDEQARRRRIGDKLTNAAIEVARRKGARNVDLTSRASRQAAHALYESVGFEVRDTNVYRYTLEG